MSKITDNLRAAYQEVQEKLKGGQHKLDHDKDGDIDGKDFAMLRNKKKSKKQTEPPTVPVKDLFAPKSFPHGVEHEYINESVNLSL